MIEVWFAVGLAVIAVVGFLYWLGRRPDPVPREVLLARTFSKVLEGERGPVLEEMRQLYKRSQRDVGIGLALGTLFRHAGKLRLATQAHKSLLAHQDLDPELEATIHAELSADYLAAGLLDRAQAAAEASLAIKPDEEMAVRYAERIYTRLRRWDDAVTVVERFGKLRREDVSERLALLRFSQGLHLWDEGEMDAAGEAFKKGQQTDSECLPVILGQARYLRRSGKPGKALTYLKKREKAFQDHGWLQLREYKKIAIAEENHRTFTDAMDAHLAEKPNDWRARAELGVFLTETGHYDEAADALLTCLQQSPHTVILHHYVWDLLRRMGKPMPVFLRYRETLSVHLDIHDAYVCNACGYRAAQLMWTCPVCFHGYTFRERTI